MGTGGVHWACIAVTWHVGSQNRSGTRWGSPLRVPLVRFLLRLSRYSTISMSLEPETIPATAPRSCLTDMVYWPGFAALGTLTECEQ